MKSDMKRNIIFAAAALAWYTLPMRVSTLCSSEMVPSDDMLASL